MNGKSPTYSEIKQKFNYSSLNAVFKHIKALEKKEVIHSNNQARGIELLDSVKQRLFSEKNPDDLPLLGQIPAGNPETIEENEIDRISISDFLVRNPEKTFLLTVKGDSINKSGILDGDLVVVDTNILPRNYDFVVALVDGENTLKQYIKNTDGTIHLCPFSTNSLHKEVIPINEARVQGVIKGSLRRY